MKVRGRTLSKQLQSAIKSCDRSVYKISKDTGIDPGTLSRFKDGKVGLSLSSVDKLVNYFGLKLVTHSRRQ